MFIFPSLEIPQWNHRWINPVAIPRSTGTSMCPTIFLKSAYRHSGNNGDDQQEKVQKRWRTDTFAQYFYDCHCCQSCRLIVFCYPWLWLNWMEICRIVPMIQNATNGDNEQERDEKVSSWSAAVDVTLIILFLQQCENVAGL
jgi:hypothetical protein